MISVVIPAYNEETVVGETVGNVAGILNESFPSEPAEIIVVDDGSSDKTATVAAKAGAQIVSNPHNVGYGLSLKRGIMTATYDTIVILDADGTYPVDTIPTLIEAYRNGFDMVVGARKGSHYEGSRTKSLLRTSLKILVEFTAGRKIPDINSGLRVFSKAESLQFFSHLCNTFSFTTSLTLAYMLTGKFVEYVPVDYYKRGGGSSKVNLFRDSLRTLQFIVQAIVYFNPIKIFLILSGILLAFSLFSFLLFVAGGSPIHLQNMGAGIVGGVVVFAIGLLTDLVRQTSK